MKYLVDTNVFMHTIEENIYEVANQCDTQDHRVCVTQTIIDELEPSYYKLIEDKSSKEVFNSINNLVNVFGLIEIIDIKDIPGAKEEFNKIRKRYYQWTSNHEYLKKLIQEGALKKEDVRNIGKKDLGECELVAIAKTSKGQYWLITNDLGRVFLHPHLNIFDMYKDDPDVKIISGLDWLRKIENDEIKTNV